MAVDEALLMSQDQTIIITTLDTEELSMLDDAPTALAQAVGLGGRKTYSCDKCDRAYYHSQSLVRHRNVECGKQPQVSCPHCPYRCKQKADMKKHINRKHSVLPAGQAASPNGPNASPVAGQAGSQGAGQTANEAASGAASQMASQIASQVGGKAGGQNASG